MTIEQAIEILKISIDLNERFEGIDGQLEREAMKVAVAVMEKEVE